MNKILIPIIVILIIIFSVSGYFIYLKKSGFLNVSQITSFEECVKSGYPILQTYPQQCRTPDGKLFTEIIEDGVGEKNNQRIGVSEPPFGFIMGSPSLDDRKKNLDGMIDVGAKWVRLSGANGIIWELAEKSKGVYDWTNYDDVISSFAKKGINVLVTVGPASRVYESERGYLPSDMNAYKSFLVKAVERYDGDGVDDAPESPIVAAWQISNEIDTDIEWKDTLQNYAKLMKESHSSIKSANSNAKVVIAGMATPFGIQKYSKILSYMREGAYFDVFDFHWHAMFGGDYRNHKTKDANKSYSFDQYLNEVKKLLEENNQGDADIWITEMSTSDVNYGQTELSQAIDLIKRYVYPDSKGVSVIFWGTLYEQAGFAGKSGNENYFNTQGLINNPKNDGLSHKKLSYYTYKKMTETLEGANWNNIQTIQEKDGIYVYKLTKNNNPIWVAWNDNEDKKNVIISMDKNIKNVKITEAVPRYETGKEVMDYESAFMESRGVITQANLHFELGDKPVFIEEER